MSRIIGYARVSTPGQATCGISLAAQITRISNYATSIGASISKMFTDIGSAYGCSKLNSDLFKYLKSRNGATHIIVCDITRFSRNKDDGLACIMAMLEMGAQITFIDENLCISADTFEANYPALTQHLMAAEQESIVLSGRIKHAKSYGKSIGNYIGGAVPYGIEVYVNAEGIKKCRPNEHQLAIARFIQKCKSDNYTAVELNELMAKITHHNMMAYPIVLVEETFGNMECDDKIRNCNTEPMTNPDIAQLLNDYEVHYKPGVAFTSSIVRNIKNVEDLEKYYSGNEDVVMQSFSQLSLKRKADADNDWMEFLEYKKSKQV